MSGDLFGFSVALSGDGSTALIGAPGTGSSGAAYAFLRSGSTWLQAQELTLPMARAVTRLAAPWRSAATAAPY